MRNPPDIVEFVQAAYQLSRHVSIQMMERRGGAVLGSVLSVESPRRWKTNKRNATLEVLKKHLP